MSQIALDMIDKLKAEAARFAQPAARDKFVSLMTEAAALITPSPGSTTTPGGAGIRTL